MTAQVPSAGNRGGNNREPDQVPADSQSPLRILQVMGKMDRGGAEAMVMTLHRQVDRKRVQFDYVVHNEPGHFDAEIRQLGGRIFLAPRYRASNHVAYCRWWAHFFGHHPEYQIAHGHIRSTAALYLGIAQRHGLVTIAHSHSTSSGGGPVGWTKAVLQYPIRHIADYLFACSRDAATWLYGSSASSRTIILNNPVELPQFAFDEQVRHEVRSELNLAGGMVIGHVGRFHPAKNHRFLIELLSELVPRNPDVVLLLVGDGELMGDVRRKASDLGLDDHVRFLGVRGDTARLMQAMDVLVFPSIYEGFPVVLVEAQASGLPCLVSDSITRDTGITDSVHFLSLADGVAVWARRLEDLEAPVSRIDAAAVVGAAGFDARSVAKWMEDFYVEVLRIQRGGE